MKREREKLRWNQISKLLKTRSCKDIWSLYNQMTGKPKEDGDLLLNTESGDTTNDPKQCAVMLIKGNISEEKPMTFKNNFHVAIISIFD